MKRQKSSFQDVRKVAQRENLENRAYKMFVRDAKRASREANRDPTLDNLAKACRENNAVLHVHMADALRSDNEEWVREVEQKDPYGKLVRKYRDLYCRRANDKLLENL